MSTATATDLVKQRLWHKLEHCCQRLHSLATVLGDRTPVLYRLDADQIRSRIDATFDEVIEQARQNQGQFIWDSISCVDR